MPKRTLLSQVSAGTEQCDTAASMSASGTKRTFRTALSDVCCLGKSGSMGDAPLLPLLTLCGHRARLLDSALV